MYQRPRRARSVPTVLCLLALLVPAPAAWAAAVKVTVEGIDGERKANVLKFLTINRLPKDELRRARVEQAHRLARAEIESALQPYGYYQPVTDAQLTLDGDTWRARYRVEPGPPTKVAALDVRAEGEGSADAGILAAIAQSKLATGRTLVHAHYSATRSAMLQAAYDAGYLDADFTASVIRVTPPLQRAEIELVLATGPRFYFGPTTIHQDVLNDEFVRRYLTFTQGEPFNTDRLTELQLALSDTDYFNQVEIQADRAAALTGNAGDAAAAGEQPLPQVPVVVTARPRKTQKYTISGGYGTDTGVRAGLGVELRRLNGRGHKFRSDLRVSEVKQALSARYIVPIDEVARDTLTFGATAQAEEYGDFDTNNVGVGVARKDGWGPLRREFYLNAEREDFSLQDGEKRNADIVFPGFGLSYTWADDPLRVRRGVGLSLDVHGGTEALLSDTDFLQLKVTGAGVWSAGERLRLLGRGEWGATWVDNFPDLPPSQRFFTGGDRSVRGYGYQEISPVNDRHQDIGGEYLAVASIELEYLVYDDYGLAAFFDVGDAADDMRFDFQRGVGVGFRWLSPIGTVRLDIAHPMDDSDEDFRIHFSLGPDI